MLRGVGGPLSVPTCFSLDMSIRRGLGFSGWALGCVRDHSGQRQAVKAGVML